MSMIEYNIWQNYFDTHPDINSYFMHAINCMRLSQCVNVPNNSFVPYWLQTDEEKESKQISKEEIIANITLLQKAFNKDN